MSAGIEFEYQKHMPFKSCGLISETAHAYLDFVLTKPWGVLILEIDENQHTAYPAACDVRRDFEICASIALGSQHKAIVLRYNPDSFRIDGKDRSIPKKERLTSLIDLIKQWDEDPAPEWHFARFFMFYDMTSESNLPIVAKEWNSEEAKQISRVIKI
jgi:hypothetical protein